MITEMYYLGEADIYRPEKGPWFACLSFIHQAYSDMSKFVR